MKPLYLILTLCSLAVMLKPVFAQDTTTGAVEGTVTDAGIPLEGVRVVIVGTDGVEYETLTDNNGEYSIAGLASGRYLMSFTKDGYQDRSNNPLTISAGGTQYISRMMLKKGHIAIDKVDPAKTAGIMSGTGSVRGIVLDTSSLQNPIEGVRVVAVNPAGIEYETQTESNGQYVIIGLPPGRYLMNFTKAGYGDRLGKPMTVSEGGDVSVAMKMSKKASFGSFLKRLFGGESTVPSKTAEEEPESHKHESGSLIWLLIIGLVIVAGVVIIGRRSRRNSE